ncbi:MAG: hypothetical protein LBD41_04830 [Clostridiales Family XIII bacterium]|jgi:hypothetical protein|nr:hypothetical protein [Clostridiales Family XIII bacterium]
MNTFNSQFNYKKIFCPAAGKSKLLFRSVADVNAFIKSKSRIDNEVSKSEIYKCEICGGYHLTTKQKERSVKKHKMKPKKKRGVASIRNNYY